MTSGQENSLVTRTHQGLDHTYAEQDDIADERDPTSPQETEELATPTGLVPAKTQGKHPNVKGLPHVNIQFWFQTS